jgi:hypothetical protein
LWSFYFAGWPLSLALVFVPLACWNRRIRWAVILLAIFLAGLSLLTGILPHYAAPAAGLLLIVQMGGLHALRYWNPQGKPTGSLLARVAMFALVAMFVQQVIQRPPGYASGDLFFKSLRKSLIARMEMDGGKNLVLVHYSPTRNVDMNFVDNGADFEERRILWARSMDAESDRKLIGYFHDRKIWLLEMDESVPQLRCLAACNLTSNARP